MPPTRDGREPLVASVVMPAYNEADMLERSVGEVIAAFREWREPFEVIVVENGSVDATALIANRLAADIPEVEALHLLAPDYGAALRAGLLHAKGDIVVNFDVDYYDVDFVAAARARLAAADTPAIVVGSKRAAGAEDRRSALRRIVTSVFAAILRYGFSLGVSDTHGMKMMQRDVVVPFARACRFGTDLFDTELILRAERAGLRTVELPVVVQERRPSRSPIWRRVPRTVWGLLRLRVMLWRMPRTGTAS